MDEFNIVHPLFGSHMVLQRGCKVPIWGKASPNDDVTVRLHTWQAQTKVQPDGSWMAFLDELQPGGPHELSISCGPITTIYQDVYVGEVWICSGQSNMDQRVARGNLYWCGVENEEQEIANARYPCIRLYSTRIRLSEQAQSEPASEFNQFTNPYTPGYSGCWTVCSPDSVGSFSATAYFFGRELFEAIQIPIGLIVSCYGASTAEAWISREALNATPELASLIEDYHRRCCEYENGTAKHLYKLSLQNWMKLVQGKRDESVTKSNLLSARPKAPMNPLIDQHSPTLLYNGMIAPLIPYAARGVVWYHGDSNGNTASKYYDLLTVLMEDWRKHWSLDLIFLIVQCANVNGPNQQAIEKGPIPLIREAQLSASRLPNTGLVVTIDIGEQDTHPRNKQEVGRRLSLLARRMVHNEYIPCEGPTYECMSLEGGRIRLHFRSAEGLMSAGPLSAFVIAGPDGDFIPATAKIDGETVVVWSDTITKPEAIRYSWSDHPRATLFNMHGLPASPFRTDRERID